MLSRIFVSRIGRTLLPLLVATPAFASELHRREPTGCGPTDVRDVVQLAHLSRVELNRGSGLTWIRLQPQVDPDALEAEAGEPLTNGDGLVEASAIQVVTSGTDCTAVVDSMQVHDGEHWRAFRLAGDNVYAPRYFRKRVTAGTIDIGFRLILLQRSYCDITVHALIYKDLPIILRPYPYPDPEC